MSDTPFIFRLISAAWDRLRGTSDKENVCSLDSAFADRIREITGCPVVHPETYEEALRHRSIARGQPDIELESYERLEFLGDAVLGLVVSQYLYIKYPEENEGFLTRMRSKLVNGPVLATYARKIELGRHLLMSENTAQANGRDNETILADAFEALVGALYLDQGYPATEAFVCKTIHSAIDIDSVLAKRSNYKSQLLEFAQAHAWTQPVYRLVAAEGPGHNREFTVEVVINEQVWGRGTAHNKKKAEQEAAKNALRKLEDGAVEHE